MSDAEVDAWFDGKLESRAVFDSAREAIEAAGASDMTVGKQISFGGKRKFAWFWLYNVTKANPSGILHLMLAIDERVENPHVRNVEQLSARRWNHQVVLRTQADAESAWLRKLIERAHAYGST